MSVVEVRPVDVDGGLKLHKEPVHENFVFTADVIKLIVHQPLSNNLYAFGKWVCQPRIRSNLSNLRIMRFTSHIIT